DVIPFFLQGAGADARPRHVAEGDHWRAMKHAELAKIGDELLAETLAILTGMNLRPIDNLTLQGKINVVQAPCERQYTTREQLESLKDEGGLLQQYAKAGLERLDMGEEIPDQVAFQVQTLWLNRDLVLIGLDVEPLCGLARTVEEIVAPAQAVLLGYTNGCVGYTPDTEEMKRGGYETGSYLPKLWSGPLKPGLEDLFASAVVLHAGN
ncbi:MAG: hypothetical protein OXI23_14210, partial [Gemmatimonadota bacterium]|nr:hypothetical protein [Gemmatimonadota bacterium]